MKQLRIALMVVVVAMTSVLPSLMYANTPSDEDSIQVNDVNDSGCIRTMRESSPKNLVLKKEGDIVTCEINGIVANCGLAYFDIQTDYVKGKDTPDSLFIIVSPIVPSEKDCTCPYNVSFTIRNMKADSFFLNCWFYTGMISFKESNLITLELSYNSVKIDGLKYDLFKPGQQAMLYEMPYGEVTSNEWRIPSTVSYEGQDYTVGAFSPDGFHGGAEILKLILPNTIFRVEGHREFYNCFNGRFQKLETIEVEPNSRLLSSVDGVLYSHDQMSIYCHPKANKRTEYTVIDGVKKIAERAFSDCSNLKVIRLPESVKVIMPYAFANCNNLEAIYIPGKLDRDYLYSAFLNMPSTTTLYVPESDVEFFKTIYKGPVLSISSSETPEYYYYANGTKYPLTLNENKVVVSIPKEYGDIIERFHSNVQTLAKIKDETFDIYVISRSEYEKLASLSFWAEDSKSVILTSSYFTENGDEVFATPYLTVRLKKEEDVDLLTSYAEQYTLRIIGNISPLMPLWFILSVTPDSDKSPLKCANELYESGDFAASVPDLADSIINTSVRYIAPDTPEKFSDLYDLQGRRLNAKPTKGIYIQNGRKVMVK